MALIKVDSLTENLLQLALKRKAEKKKNELMGLLSMLLIYGIAYKDFGWALSWIPVHRMNNY